MAPPPPLRRAGNSCAIAPMCPAPMVTTTSPAPQHVAQRGGDVLDLATKIGSTLPRLRTARQIARPSAPLIGASPAA
jgi:hypothetical protein